MNGRKGFCDGWNRREILVEWKERLFVMGGTWERYLVNGRKGFCDWWNRREILVEWKEGLFVMGGT